MLVECVTKSIKDISIDPLLRSQLVQSAHVEEGNLDLTIGKVYVVYALWMQKGVPWYCIADDIFEFTSYPLAYPPPLFRVVDNRLSKYWVYSCWDQATGEAILTFPQWAADRSFYERLLDGMELELSVFRQYKALMDAEFPDPSVSNSAALVEGNWVICPRCNDAWNNISKDAMVTCPNCSARLRNPKSTD